MKRKNLTLSVIAILALIAMVVGLASCTSNSKTEDDQNAPSQTSGAITVISREDGSGTRDAFTELMGIVDESGNDATTMTAEITNSTSVMASTVQGNAKAIGYVSLGSLSDKVKALKVDGVAPSVETVKDGTYKLQRPFNIAYKEAEISETAKDFMAYIMSTEGQAVIEEEGYISIDTTTSYKASGAKGTVTVAGSTSVAPVMNVLADKYRALNPDVTVEIQESGSSAGIESAIQGAVEIAMSSRELTSEELESLKSEKIATDGIAVIVNQSNSFDGLTSEQIKSIYLGTTTKWEEVK